MFKLFIVWEVPFLLDSLVIEEMDISERDNAHARREEKEEHHFRWSHFWLARKVTQPFRTCKRI